MGSRKDILNTDTSLNSISNNSIHKESEQEDYSAKHSKQSPVPQLPKFICLKKPIKHFSKRISSESNKKRVYIIIY